MSSKIHSPCVPLRPCWPPPWPACPRKRWPQAPGGRRFYPDDPLWRDDDMRTIPPPAEHDLSKSYEFVANTFGETARSFGPALNVNTLGEVPDSSWFTNRIGQHDMTIEDVLRGPDQVTGRPPASGRSPAAPMRASRRSSPFVTRAVTPI